MKIYNLSYEDIYKLASTANTTANSALSIANKAMPKSGGQFTGNITAYTASSFPAAACIRGIEVWDSGNTKQVVTGLIHMNRK